MRQTGLLAAIAGLALAGCTMPVAEPDTQEIGALPERVAAMAGPDQDLTTARLLPEDNCYWYAHNGPVETTLLPLRTADGRAICIATEGG